VQGLAGISFAMVLICAWVVGTRLLLLARRTRGLPEASLGAMLLSLIGLGYPLAILAQAESLLGLSASKGIQIASNSMIDLGMGLPLLFTGYVFRHDSRAARSICLGAVFLLSVHLGASTVIALHLERMTDAISAVGRWAQIPLSIGIFGFAWTGIESLRYRMLLARRAALGLGDPVVANRMTLWGALGLVTAAGALANSLFLIFEIDVVGDPLALALTSCVGIAQAALLYFAFLPPRSYLAWVIDGQTA
jgi:hypothetical protein